MAFQSVCTDRVNNFCSYFWDSSPYQYGSSDVGNGRDVKNGSKLRCSCPGCVCLVEGAPSSALLVLRSISQLMFRGKKLEA